MMKKIFITFLFFTLIFTLKGNPVMANDIYSYKVKKADGSTQSMSDFKDKVLLVVNVASKCGFTPQYDGLEKLYKDYHDKGLEIIGFPCNQFGGQEPGSDAEIQNYCRLNHGVTFPVMAKIDVNGDKADPLYVWLKSEAPGVLGTEGIKWNFTKFLLGKDGHVIDRFSSQTKPSALTKAIEKALGQ